MKDAKDDEKPKRLREVGKRVRQWRAKRGLTQAALAKACVLRGYRINRNTIAKIESGTRSINDVELFVLALALKVSIEQMYPHAFDYHLKKGTYGDFT